MEIKIPEVNRPEEDKEVKEDLKKKFCFNFDKLKWRDLESDKSSKNFFFNVNIFRCNKTLIECMTNRVNQIAFLLSSKKHLTSSDIITF